MKLKPPAGIPHALLFLLPFLPLWGYYPVAMVVAWIIGLWLSLQMAFRVQKKMSFSLADLGALALLVAVGVTCLTDLVRRDCSALSPATANALLIPLLFMGLSRSGRDFLSSRIFRALPFIMLGFWLIWTAWHGITVDYTTLTTRLTYADGFGNISQIAMYAAFSLLLIAANEKNNLYGLLAAGAMALGIAWLLHSKMLFGVTFLAGMACATRSLSLRHIRFLATGLIVLGAVLLLLIQLDSLEGRADVFQAVLQDFSLNAMEGVGPGEMDAFFNYTFTEGEAANTIGEISHLAFNDYLQALVELGLLGFLGLALISIATLVGKQVLLGLALVGISFTMFPLQYAESSTLWCLVALALSGNRSLFALPNLRVALPLATLAGLALALFFAVNYGRLYQADQRIGAGEVDQGLAQYESLSPLFLWDDEFHLLHGDHLEKAGQIPQALAAYRLAGGLNPSYEALTHLADLEFSMGRAQTASERYQTAGRLRPALLYPRYRQVYCLLELDQPEAGREMAKSLLMEFGSGQVPLQAIMLGELRELVGEE